MSTNDEAVREAVKQHYGKAARAVARSSAASCAPASGCCAPSSAAETPSKDPITRDLYDANQAGEVPAEALLASLGCGNPTALAELAPGEVVLDLGSGGGIDVLLSARRVGPTGKAYGLDMTDEMLELARANQRKAGATNVEFLRGTIESIPLPSGAVDVVISNCVINLSADKRRVFAEAFRVLKPGGRLAVSDIVLRRELPAPLRESVEMWTGCVAGALLEADYVAELAEAGFVDVTVEPTRVFGEQDAQELAGGSCCGGDSSCGSAAPSGIGDAVISAFIRARKPAAR